MRHKYLSVCLLACACVAMWGCSLDEVFSLDVSKNSCKDVRSLEMYEFDMNGDVVMRKYCTAGEPCAKEKDYRGALKYGICPDDMPICRVGVGGRFCSVCRDDYIVCGKDSNNQVKCIDPMTDNAYCGAKGLCNSDDAGSQHFRGTVCNSNHKCVDGKCVLEEGYCDSEVKYPVCDGNKAVRCDDKTGKKLTEDCEKRGLVCDDGVCKEPKCADAGITHGSCSEDGKTYFTCDEDGRVHRETCNADMPCRPVVGCNKECEKDACYDDKSKSSLYKKCVNGRYKEDEPCQQNTYCKDDEVKGAVCVCNVGDRLCGQIQAGDMADGKVGDWGVRSCQVNADTGDFEWKFIETCSSDFPLCENGKCVQDKHDIGSPCQIVVKDTEGNDFVCQGNVAENTLCTIMLSGNDIYNYLNKEKIQATGQLNDWDGVEKALDHLDNFMSYTNSIFPKDESVIRGCEDVVVPEGMQLGCITSEALIVSKWSGSLGAIAFKFLFSNSVGFNNLYDRIVEGMLGRGVSFTAPNGYCVVGAYDATLSGFYFNSFFMTKNQDGSMKAAGFHNQDNPKIEGAVDLVNSKPKHPEAAAAIAAGKCPEGTVGFSFTEPLVYEVANREVDGVTKDVVDYVIRVGYDVCLKACEDLENSSDCRDGYKCMKIPTRAACAYEEVADVIAQGEFKTACLAEGTFAELVKDRNVAQFGDAEGTVRPKESDERCQKGLCCGSLERDWQTVNVSCNSIIENGDAACLR